MQMEDQVRKPQMEKIIDEIRAAGITSRDQLFASNILFEVIRGSSSVKKGLKNNETETNNLKRACMNVDNYCYRKLFFGLLISN